MSIHDDIAILAHAMDFRDPELILDAYCNLMGVDESTAEVELAALVTSCDLDPKRISTAFRQLLVDEGFILRSQMDLLEES